MLPVNIIANWCRTPATLADFKSVLGAYNECAVDEEYAENTHAVSWLERTRFTFGDSEWSRNEGSLIFENKRVVLWREDPDDQAQAHLIFLALFPSSLVHLERSVSDLMYELHQLKIVPTTFVLDEVAGKLNPESIAGAELITEGEERILFSGAAPFVDPALAKMFYQMWRGSELGIDTHVSKLFLRLDEPQTGIVLSSDGVLTFNDPDLTLDEIVGVVSRVIKEIPMRIEEMERAQAAGESASAGDAEAVLKFYDDEEMEQATAAGEAEREVESYEEEE